MWPQGYASGFTAVTSQLVRMHTCACNGEAVLKRGQLFRPYAMMHAGSAHGFPMALASGLQNARAGNPDDWHKMIKLDLEVPMRLTRRLSPAMVRARTTVVYALTLIPRACFAHGRTP